MDNLFYSPAEKILFWVAGYTDNSDNVKEIIKMLAEKSLFFAKATRIFTKDVNTRVVLESSRYRDMRVFYAKCDNPPADAFQINTANGWTMTKWLEN